VAVSVSGFTFIHNGIESGYPFVEAIKAVQPYVDEMVAVDMQSTDQTRDILQALGVRVIDGCWGNQAGETLKAAHARYIDCSGDVILHFEADEVWEDRLVQQARRLIDGGDWNLTVYRLQLEQNFQRCRWYPELVHRVFGKWDNIIKEGHTTDKPHLAQVIPPDYGYLWDITNCFKYNWLNRITKQAELWNKEPQFIMAPLHVMHRAEYSQDEAIRKLGERHWTMTETPFRIPGILSNLVGKTTYDPKLNLSLGN
jgi:hypothetical protein